MGQTGYVYPVISDETLHFTEALAQNAASAMYNLPLPLALANKRAIIRAVTVIAKEGFQPEFNFFASANGVNADPALDKFLGRVLFASTDPEQFAAAGVFRAYKENLAIPYIDFDTQDSTTPSTLHVVLVNRSATLKSAGAAGDIVALFHLEPESEY